MKSEIRNGKVVVINETFKESFETLNELLAEKQMPPLSENEARREWNIVGGETNAELQEWVNDFVSEIHTEKCAAKDAWRYEV